MANRVLKVAYTGGLSKAAEPTPALNIRRVFKYLVEL